MVEYGKGNKDAVMVLAYPAVKAVPRPKPEPRMPEPEPEPKPRKFFGLFGG